MFYIVFWLVSTHCNMQTYKLIFLLLLKKNINKARLLMDFLQREKVCYFKLQVNLDKHNSSAISTDSYPSSLALLISLGIDSILGLQKQEAWTYMEWDPEWMAGPLVHSPPWIIAALTWQCSLQPLLSKEHHSVSKPNFHHPFSQKRDLSGIKHRETILQKWWHPDQEHWGPAPPKQEENSGHAPVVCPVRGCRNRDVAPMQEPGSAQCYSFTLPLPYAGCSLS